MNKNLKGTKTEKNVLASFAGESQARNRYTYFASAAKKEGYEQISAIFLETAENEKEHAKRFFNLLEGGAVEIIAKYPAGEVKSTLDNLKASAAGENEEWTMLYVDAAKIADEEGLPKIAEQFRQIAKVEKEHEARYRKLIENIEKGLVFKKDSKVKWHCRNCGYVIDGNTAPNKCPACEHPQAYFEYFVETY
ncbi:MAG: rubrerythrin family protein [Candidatus Saganbacteria bacterium]|nr:rubrerythrin family protein [Candidatus Saganbacteria bacterium]